MILYEGKSLLDPEVPIVVVATEDSNPKTGRMLYTWILRQDRPPEVAAYDGSDAAICGDCRFRADPIMADSLLNVADPAQDWYKEVIQRSRTCYVRLSPAEGADEAMPPSEVWRKWKAGEFAHPNLDNEDEPGIEDQWEHWDIAGFRDGLRDMVVYEGPLPVRIGSYGDPAAVPTRVWAELVRYQKHWTGYTHFAIPKKCEWCKGEGTQEWFDVVTECTEGCDDGLIHRCDPDLKRYCMASVDTPEERAEAQALGWRTFMVVPEQIDINLLETPSMAYTADILCPATDPHPKRGKVCRDCGGEGKLYENAEAQTLTPCPSCGGSGRVNTTCATCLLCRGTSASAPSIWEVVHSKNASNHKW